MMISKSRDPGFNYMCECSQPRALSPVVTLLLSALLLGVEQAMN